MTEFRFSLRNACTARIPPNVSTNCTMTRAMASLVRRYARADSRRNHAVSQASGIKPTSTTRPSCQSRSSMLVPTSNRVKMAAMSESRPSSNRSDIESMSEVCREMTRPEV